MGATAVPEATTVSDTMKDAGEPVLSPGSPLEDALRLAGVAARSSCPVFLRGESGCGKEMVARFLHRSGPRARGPFVAVNCAALPHGLIESELFGHRKGAFTGAFADSPGKFRLAQGGTLLLDEIGDMPLDVQTRLLRVLQEKTVSPVGDSRDHPVDFRLVCATHRDLKRAVADGLFREDLYYRLDVVRIDIPPLRERPLDIPPLVRHFLSSLLPPQEARAAAEAFPPRLLSFPFPGNIRELRNLVERYAVMRELGWGWLEAAHAAGVPEKLPAGRANASNPGVSRPLPQTLPRIRNSRVSDCEILSALAACGHHRAKASTLLGISRRALQYRLARMETVN
jgi:DNA-binding NtrC family response regulator